MSAPLGIRRSSSSLETLEARIAPAVIYGVDKSTRELVAFDSAQPNIILADIDITGIPVGETIEGIDFRPANGQLYALASTAANEGRLYVINTTTGAATAVGPYFAVPLDGGTNARFDIDFNPQVDRLRVVSSGGQNFRVNPDTGAIVDSNSNTGVIELDAPLTYNAGDSNAGTTPNIAGVAYTNSFAGAVQTTLFYLDSALEGLASSTAPNDGVLDTVGALKIADGEIHGFDLLPGSTTGFASLRIGGVDKLLTVNTTTGAAKILGDITTLGGGIDSLAVVPNGLGIVGKKATYRDLDGDTVTLTTTKGAFLPGQFTFSTVTPFGGAALLQLNLTDPEFSGAAIKTSAKATSVGGNGTAELGRINAAGVNLASISLDGDLAALTVGTVAVDGAALGTLTLRSAGAFNLATLPPGDAAGFVINGDVGAMKIGGVAFAPTQINGTLGSFSAALATGSFTATGITKIFQATDFFSLQLAVAGNVKSIQAEAVFQSTINITGSLGALTVSDQSSLLQLTTTGNVEKVTLNNLLQGTLDISGNFGSLVSSRGSLVGFTLQVDGNVDAIAVKRIFQGQFQVGGRLGTFKSSGDVLALSMAIDGIDTPTNVAEALAIRSFTVGGDFISGFVGVGYAALGNPSNADVQVGRITVNGDWQSSSFVVGVEDGADNALGTTDDVEINLGEQANIISRIGQITIKGSMGVGNGNCVIEAGQIGKASVGELGLIFSPDRDRFRFGPGLTALIQDVTAEI